MSVTAISAAKITFRFRAARSRSLIRLCQGSSTGRSAPWFAAHSARAFLLLFVSGFVSASEVAFFSLTPGDLNEIGEENRPADPVIKRLLERSEYLLASILIANNFVNVAVVMLCTYAINAWINFSAAPLLGFVLETILLTFLLLLFGEIMPKIYAQKNSLRFVRFSASVLSGLERFCRPFSKILVNSTSVINKALAKKKYDISVDELYGLDYEDVKGVC